MIEETEEVVEVVLGGMMLLDWLVWGCSWFSSSAISFERQ